MTHNGGVAMCQSSEHEFVVERFMSGPRKVSNSQPGGPLEMPR
jgi:hypothetical protein